MITSTGRARRYALIFAAGTSLSMAILLIDLRRHDGDVTGWLRVGELAASRPAIERDFDDPLLAPDDWGHDGQQFYVLATRFPDLPAAESDVDRVTYRGRRVLLPALAAPFGTGPPVVWAMALINAFSVGAICAAFAVLADRLRAPPAIGLLAVLSPGLIDGLVGSLADGLAVALALWGLVVWRRHLVTALVLFTLGTLARETVLVAPLICVVLDRGARRFSFLLPAATYGAWLLFTGWWLRPADTSDGVVQEAGGQLGMPFRGWFDAGLTGPAVLLGTLLLVCAATAAWRLRRSLPELSLWLCAEGAFLVLADVGVAARPLNLARLAPLALPALALAVTASIDVDGAPVPGGPAEARSAGAPD